MTRRTLALVRTVYTDPAHTLHTYCIITLWSSRDVSFALALSVGQEAAPYL